MDKSGKIGYNGKWLAVRPTFLTALLHGGTKVFREGDAMRYKKSVFRSLAMVTQLGLCVLTPTILGIAAGSFLDARFGTKVTLILLILGVLGGGRGAYLTAKRIVEQEAREEKTERERQLREVLADAGNSADRPKRPSRILTADSAENGPADRAAPRGEDSA